MSLSMLEKLQLQQGVAIVLVRSVDDRGEPLYAYLKCSSQQYDDLRRAFEQKRIFSFWEMGEVLVYGFGHTPPEEVRARIEAMS